ncbi:hypothetical protein LIA77_11731 [Sarocladium implicatum]|nr:hypothetical protein LIA77_11731 [Sarocladium implicatum]
MDLLRCGRKTMEATDGLLVQGGLTVTRKIEDDGCGAAAGLPSVIACPYPSWNALEIRDTCHKPLLLWALWRAELGRSCLIAVWDTAFPMGKPR